MLGVMLKVPIYVDRYPLHLIGVKQGFDIDD